MHEDRRDAGEAHHVGMDDAQHEARRNPGIDGVAAGFEDSRGRLGRERMTRRTP